MRYMLRLAYSGLGFHGWQRQPNASSVQQTLEEALAVILRHPVELTGAGRTDAGVHARTMFAHFDTEASITSHEKFLISLNRLSGHNIAVQELINVQDDAHARFDATSRTYKYFIASRKSPFLQDLSWFVPTPLNVDSMNDAARLLLDTEDFTSFAKLHSDAKTNICRVTEASWENWENNFCVPGLVFTITADRFLRNMVRAVVGTLVEVGRGKLDTEGFRRVIEAKDRCVAGNSVPPQGLFLWDITYPYLK
ncbi:MAG: tRNA pseudouridine(38-40) synthase TruA [Muribaculaceae bacterium]|nr:tRNA pseudouridine(38-40) synthase TruA [Muribaculaceae bacterium]